MKKFISVIAILLIVVGVFMITSSEFVADNEPAAIEKELEKFINRPAGNLKVKLLKLEQIDASDTSVAVFSINDNQAGYAKLEHRWFNKVKIIHTRHGTSPISYERIETNKGNYAMLYGVKPDLTIHTVQITCIESGNPQFIDVSNSEVIFVVDKIEGNDNRAIAPELLFFTKDGKDVTAHYF